MRGYIWAPISALHFSFFEIAIFNQKTRPGEALGTPPHFTWPRGRSRGSRGSPGRSRGFPGRSGSSPTAPRPPGAPPDAPEALPGVVGAPKAFSDVPGVLPELHGALPNSSGSSWSGRGSYGTVSILPGLSSALPRLCRTPTGLSAPLLCAPPHAGVATLWETPTSLRFADPTRGCAAAGLRQAHKFFVGRAQSRSPNRGGGWRR